MLITYQHLSSIDISVMDKRSVDKFPLSNFECTDHSVFISNPN